MAQIQQRRGALTAKVVAAIKGQVADGTLVRGQYLPSERTLANELGLSRVTVRRGLDELVQDQLLTRIACKGYAVNGGSNDPSVLLSKKTVVFLHSHPDTSFFGDHRHAQIWTGAKEEAERSGLMMMVSSISKDELTPERAEELAEVAGGILCDHSNSAYLRTLVEAGIPVVQVDYHRDPDLPIDAIVQDDAGGMTLGVNHLYAQGHRRIGFIDSTEQYRAQDRALNAEQRLAGFRAITGTLGISEECVILPVANDEAQALQSFLDQEVTALVFPHLDHLGEFRAELKKRNIHPGSGFDIVAWGLRSSPEEDNEGLMSITWCREQMGRQGVRRLLARMQGDDDAPTTTVIPCQLIKPSAINSESIAQREI